MSILTKTIALTIFLSINIQAVQGHELATLSVKDFQAIKNAKKYTQANLSEYEINNDELVTLYKITPDKRKPLPTKKKMKIPFVVVVASSLK